MLSEISSDIMARTTLNIDTPLLQELKMLQKREGKSLGRIVSELLAEALSNHGRKKRTRQVFRWVRSFMADATATRLCP